MALSAKHDVLTTCGMLAGFAERNPENRRDFPEKLRDK
jgi:hypothetical protein